MDHDFPDQFRKWHSCDPFSLFDAPIVSKISKDGAAIERNLAAEARRADMLMIWTDCDREGEHIGSEVSRVCRQSKPQIQVKRARFSAIIPQQIHRAAQNPVELDMAQADAVEARMLLDLRIGAAFTRMQTLSLQNNLPQKFEGNGPISYGAPPPHLRLFLYLLGSTRECTLLARPLSVSNPGICGRSLQPS
jgi:DNA topoisomerase III